MERLDEVAAATKEKAAEELPAADIVRLASDAGPEHEGRAGKTFAKRVANETNKRSAKDRRDKCTRRNTPQTRQNENEVASGLGWIYAH